MRRPGEITRYERELAMIVLLNITATGPIPQRRIDRERTVRNMLTLRYIERDLAEMERAS